MCAFPSQWPMKAHWWIENKKAEEGADPLLLLCHMPPGPCVCLFSFNFDRISSLQIQESNYFLSQYRAVVRNISAYSASCWGWEDLDSSCLESETIEDTYQSFGLCFQWTNQGFHHSEIGLPGEFHGGEQDVFLLSPDLHLLSIVIFKKLLSWSWWRDLQMFHESS